MNRRYLANLVGWAEAIAAAARAKLEEEARREYEINDTRANWDMGEVGVHARLAHTSLYVEDMQTFLKWLADEQPTEVVTVLAARNPEWVRRWREDRAMLVAAGKADAPPGTKLVEGGQFQGITLKMNGAHASYAKAAAARVAELEDPERAWRELFARVDTPVKEG
jgi:hypothetical protein